MFGKLFMIGFAIFVIYALYGLFIVGDPDVVKFRNACWDREMHRLSAVEFEAFKTQIILKCDEELKAYLRTKSK